MGERTRFFPETMKIMTDRSSIANGLLAVAALVALVYIVKCYCASQASSKEHMELTQPGTQPDEMAGYDAGSENVLSAGSPLPADPAASDVRGIEYVEQEHERDGDPTDPFPKDRLVAQDLLPKDAANEKWARVNPASAGDVDDKNFLSAGYLTGINTVSGSLRNANQQLRSEPPNPRARVSVWAQSTIEPDLNRRPFEIDGGAF